MIIHQARPYDPIDENVFGCDDCNEKTTDLEGWDGDESTERHYCPYHAAERMIFDTDAIDLEEEKSDSTTTTE